MAEKLPQKLELGVAEVRRNLGKLLNHVHRGEEHIVVKKLSTPIAVIISIQDYEQYQQFLAQKMSIAKRRADEARRLSACGGAASHRELSQKVSAEASKQGLTPEQLLDEIKETRQTLFFDKI